MSDIGKLGLSRRSQSALANADIIAIKDLKMLSKLERKQIRNVGSASLLDIEKCLARWDKRTGKKRDRVETPTVMFDKLKRQAASVKEHEQKLDSARAALFATVKEIKTRMDVPLDGLANGVTRVDSQGYYVLSDYDDETTNES